MELLKKLKTGKKKKHHIGDHGPILSHLEQGQRLEY